MLFCFIEYKMINIDYFKCCLAIIVLDYTLYIKCPYINSRNNFSPLCEISIHNVFTCVCPASIPIHRKIEYCIIIVLIFIRIPNVRFIEFDAIIVQYHACCCYLANLCRLQSNLQILKLYNRYGHIQYRNL